MAKLSYRDWQANQLRMGNVVNIHDIMVDVMENYGNYETMRFDEIVGIVSANCLIFADEELRGALQRELRRGMKSGEIDKTSYAHYRLRKPDERHNG